MPFIPHTPSDVGDMLAAIGVARIDDLFDEIPDALRCGELRDLPAALSEMEVGRLMAERAAQDGRPLNFIGAGAYEHHIPAAVWSTITRGEIYSAYTPYQAEASQGTLQIIFEYQTMMANLTGMAVSNASLYDGASALAEAALMAVRANRRSTAQRILLPQSVHPHYQACARDICHLQGVAFDAVPFEAQWGSTSVARLEVTAPADVTALVIQQPNFFGVLEDVDALTDWAHARGALVIAVVNPMTLALLKPPGEWGARGADIVVGEGQPFGVPLSGGGPYFGFMTTRMEYVRQMPGRIVGRTIDLDGRTGYALTLQAREQHIRRSKATSNICTNQGLLMAAATVYLAILGAEGIERVAAASLAHTRTLRELCTTDSGIVPAFASEHFHEVLLRLPVPVAPVLDRLAGLGIAGGFDVSRLYPQLGHVLLVCATETKTDDDLRRYAEALRAAVDDIRNAGEASL